MKKAWRTIIILIVYEPLHDCKGSCQRAAKFVKSRKTSECRNGEVVLPLWNNLSNFLFITDTSVKDSGGFNGIDRVLSQEHMNPTN